VIFRDDYQSPHSDNIEKMRSKASAPTEIPCLH
jgi:hypothetical protein